MIEVAGFPDGTPSRDGDGVDLPQRAARCASCARPRRRRRSWRSGWPACSASAPRWPGPPARAAPGRCARRAGRPRRVGAGGADRAGRAAARARHGGREAAHLGAASRAPGPQAGARPRSRAARATRARSCCPGRSSPTTPGAAPIDAILPRVTDRPVAVRYETPYSDPHATDLLWTVDRPRAAAAACCPGSCCRCCELMGAGAVVTGSDDDIPRSGAVDAAAAAAELAGQGLGAPARSYGPRAPLPPAARRARPARGAAAGAPLRRAARAAGSCTWRPPARPPSSTAAPRAWPAWPPSARCPSDAPDPLRRRPVGRRAAARRPRAGADVVVTDSNRRRRFMPEFGAPEPRRARCAENEPLDENFALDRPLPRARQRLPDGGGAATARATCARPSEGGLLEFPEHARDRRLRRRPLDHLGGRPLLPARATRWIEIGFERPRDVPYVDLLPTARLARDRDARSTSTACGPGSGPGVNRVPVRPEGRRRSCASRSPRSTSPPGDLRGVGGFREIRIPGVQVRAVAAPAGARRRARWPAATSSRVGADLPVRAHDRRRTRSAATARPAARCSSWPRTARTPSARSTACVFAPGRALLRRSTPGCTPRSTRRDSALDRLAGRARRRRRFDSSGRFHNQPRYRASSAFDGRAGHRLARHLGAARPPRSRGSRGRSRAAARRVSRLRLEARRRGRRAGPRAVRLSWPGGTTPPLRRGRRRHGRAAAAGARARASA